jgi:hypothetical protein
MRHTRFFHFIRVVPVFLVVMTLVWSRVMFHESHSFAISEVGKTVSRGGVSSMGLLYTFLEGEESFKEVEGEQCQHDGKIDHFKEGHSYLNGWVSAGYWLQGKRSNVLIQLTDVALYRMYCQLKIDC